MSDRLTTTTVPPIGDTMAAKDNAWDLVETNHNVTTDSAHEISSSETKPIDETTSVPELLAVLQGGSNATKRVSLAWLYRHAHYLAYRRQLRQHNGPIVLLKTIENLQDEYDCQLYAMGCLAYLNEQDADSPDDKPLYLDQSRPFVRDPMPSDFTRLFDAIEATRPDVERIEALELVGCLYEAHPKTSNLIDLIPRIVFLLRNRNPQLSMAAARCVGHLANTHADRLSDDGAIPLLVELIRHGNVSVKNMAMSALSELVEKREEYQTRAVSAGVMELLVPLLQDGDSEPRMSASTDARKPRQRESESSNRRGRGCSGHRQGSCHYASFLSLSLVHFSDGLDRDYVRQGPSTQSIGVCGGWSAYCASPVGSEALQEVTAKAISYLVVTHEPNKVLALEAGIIDLLVPKLRDGPAKADVVEVLGIVALKDAFVKLRIVQAGGLALLVELVRDGNEEEKEKAMRTLAYIAENNESYAVEMELLGVLPLLVEILQTSMEYQKEDLARAALCPLMILSEIPRLQDALLALGIQRVLGNTKDLSATTKLLVNAVQTKLSLSLRPATTSTDNLPIQLNSLECRIM